MGMTIGIIEDDKLLNQALELAFAKAGYKTVCSYSVKEALADIKGNEDLLLIDVGLPDGDGITLCRTIRKKRKVPAIFLTARDEEWDMLAAYDAGAEDYVVKPFSMKVLLRRVEVALRRQRAQSVLCCGELSLYPEKKKVLREGEEIVLTAKEYQLLEYLMRNQGQVLTKENILEQIWGVDGQFVVDNTVSVTINRLRRKIEPDAKKPVYIQNVFGLGYRMKEGSDDGSVG